MSLLDGTTAIARLKVTSVFQLDAAKFCESVLQTVSTEHSGVRLWLEVLSGAVCLGGALSCLRPIAEIPSLKQYDHLITTAPEVRHWIRSVSPRGGASCVAFQTRNPLHLGHVELVREAVRRFPHPLLLQSTIGPTQDDDFDVVTRIRSYHAVVQHFFDGAPVSSPLKLCMLPLPMSMGGPREALHHAIVRRNFGATHFIVGRDHAGPSSRTPFYRPYAAQELVLARASRIGIAIITGKELRYDAATDSYCANPTVPRSLSGTKVREMFQSGVRVPDWFMSHSVSEALQRSKLRDSGRFGTVVLFTGLSAAGKTTVARMAERLCNDRGIHSVVVDGDEMRAKLSAGLGFSAQDRMTHVLRCVEVAVTAAHSGAVAFVSVIAPLATIRDAARRIVDGAEPKRRFVLAWVSTPLAVCAQRDPKGLYRKALSGEIPEFTGVSAPFEEPADADIQLGEATALDNARKLLAYVL